MSSRFLCWKATKAVGQHINTTFVVELHRECRVSASLLANVSVYLKIFISTARKKTGVHACPLIDRIFDETFCC